MLRDAGIDALNLDLIYGLPHPDGSAMVATVAHACALKPGRRAPFGYAHVPSMKPHQRLLPEEALPDADE